MWSLGLLLLLFGSCRADLFTAIADMQRMLGAEKEVTAVIEKYIEAEQKRLEELKRSVDHTHYFEVIRETLSSGTERFLPTRLL
ncbi:unnamed protein product [Nippostrongylus brasiliensis]|uniref:P4Ha_N domain-containing protein n=1 Tax=Nippostrongylus brasiliensis TaxID=27835 RepID=A0A0N4XWJ7_NIPBR|nr:unnamed protein product [Nippostrongylus brasiliensis]